MPANDALYLSVSEFAHAVRLSEATVRRAHAEGRLRAVRLRPDGALRIPRSELDRLLLSSPNPARVTPPSARAGSLRGTGEAA